MAVGLSLSGRQALELAAWHPDRVLGVVAIAPALPFYCDGFNDVRDSYEGRAKINRHYFRQDYRGFVEFFMSGVFTEPHSIKQFEDGVSWGLETTSETLIDTVDALLAEPDEAEKICRAVRCPVLVIHGTKDAIVPYDRGVRVAEWTDGELVTFIGAGHGVPQRHPVRTNLLIREFAISLGKARSPRSRSWTPMVARAQRRALFVSSPIGLGHIRRDLAVADELRALHPHLRIDWLAQHPVTEVLARRGEHIHPASHALASEVAHFRGGVSRA